MTNKEQFRNLVSGYFGIENMDSYSSKVYVLKDIEEYIKDYIEINEITDVDFKKEVEYVKDNVSLIRNLQDSLLVLLKVKADLELILMVKKRIKELDSLDIDFQMIVVCGNNKTLKNRVDSLATRKKILCYGYANNVDVLMDASDCVITKPGGLTVSEGLAKGMPLILINPIPGQEDRNVEFLLNNGMAQLVTSTYPVDEAIYQLFNNEWKIGNLSQGIKYIGKPYATRDLCEFILGLEER